MMGKVFLDMKMFKKVSCCVFTECMFLKFTLFLHICPNLWSLCTITLPMRKFNGLDEKKMNKMEWIEGNYTVLYNETPKLVIQFIKFIFLYLYFMYICVLHEYVCLCTTYMQYPQRSAKIDRSLGTRITESCGLPWWVRELNPDPPQEQPMLVTAELPLQASDISILFLFKINFIIYSHVCLSVLM